MEQNKYKLVLRMLWEGLSIGLVVGLVAGYFYFFK